MNFILNLIILALLIARLANDFQRDKGFNKKAKIFQSIILGLIVVVYSVFVRQIIWVFRHFNQASERFTADVGVVSGKLHIVIFVFHILVSFIVIMLCFSMAKRNVKAKQQFFYFLPLLALTEVFNFYRGWLSSGDEILVNQGIIILIAVLFYGGISTVILLICKSKLMKEFYAVNEYSVENRINEIQENKTTLNE